MSNINYQALREIAKQATQGEWVAFISPGKYGTYAVHTPGDNHHGDIVDWPGFDGQKNAENNARYIAAFNPEVVQALLDEREAAEKRIAELEAKLETADKLQDSAFRHGLQHGFSLGQTDDQAGFEECLSAYGTWGKDNG